MNGQQSLFAQQESLADKFFKFHRDNPGVFEAFERYAKQAISAGRTKLSARLIIERIRWDYYIETRGDSFKINNNHTPFYSRLFEKAHPEYEGYFTKRKRRSL